MADWRRFTLYWAVLPFSTGLTFSALGQDADVGTRAERLTLEEVVVTARRREELLQDVPISMSVFSQQQLDDANIVNAGDLALYTPSLQSNNRFGGDSTTFAIRGFSQELRTTASVGVYFADVVALRGANAIISGDGAGPGDFFDLASVQVLKGPTGTLFGRNTTGGAVLLTPNPPTEEFDAYIEGGTGNYGMVQGQAMINGPVSDNFRLRFAVDHQDREGYLDNISGIGPKDFADVDYVAYRLSSLWDITDALENYTILRYTNSENNGYPGSIFACNKSAAFGSFCAADLAERDANGQNGFYDVYNFIPDPVNKIESAQAINTTSWEISDDLLIKNILAYGTLETKQRNAIFGTNWKIAGQPFMFQMVGLSDSFPSTDQETWVEEFQVQGNALDERLAWQGGVYYENSKPRDDYGAQSAAIIACDQSSITSGNPADFRCSNVFGVGSVLSLAGGVEYTNKAVYAQGTYDLTDEYSVTAGLRYTDDETDGTVTDTVYKFPKAPPGQLVPPDFALTQAEERAPNTDSSEPTWLLGLDYKPEDDLLLYGKYSRGYRQGSVNISGSSGLDTHDPETVDTYEIGSKSSFHTKMPATLNLALFYNDFQDQQIQFGYFNPAGVGTTAVVNAGASTIWGVELEGNIQLTDNLILTTSYAYLNTNVDELVLPPVPPDTVTTTPSLTTAAGEPLSFAPENKLVMTATYLLPVPVDLGSMRVAATYVFTDEMQAVSEESSVLATMPDYNLFNFNFGWDGVLNSPVDVSVFVTNATDEEYVTYVIGLWNYGIEGGAVGMPRMYGMRVRYNFGL